ncbi:MAG: hypothetical protein V1914_02880 [archaeon]
MKFKEEDIGKIVVLSLDPEKHHLGKLLGASEVEIRGEIVSLNEDYLELQTIPYNSGPLPVASSKHKIRYIMYDQIIGCEIDQYVKYTSKTSSKIDLSKVAEGLKDKK